MIPRIAATVSRLVKTGASVAARLAEGGASVLGVRVRDSGTPVRRRTRDGRIADPPIRSADRRRDDRRCRQRSGRA